MDRTTTIDMYTPSEVCLALDIDRPQLVELVNNGSVACYRIGGHLRFRQMDIEAVRPAQAAV